MRSSEEPVFVRGRREPQSRARLLSSRLSKRAFEDDDQLFPMGLFVRTKGGPLDASEFEEELCKLLQGYGTAERKDLQPRIEETPSAVPLNPQHPLVNSFELLTRVISRNSASSSRATRGLCTTLRET